MPDIDPRDQALLDQVRAALDEKDPVPDPVVEAARASLTWLTVDAEAATLSEDTALTGAGVRSNDGSRVLAFECDTGVIVLEVTTTDDTRRVVGHADRAAHLTMRHPGASTEFDTDEHGRFLVEGIAAGPVSLRCVFADAPDAPVVTSWVLVLGKPSPVVLTPSVSTSARQRVADAALAAAYDRPVSVLEETTRLLLGGDDDEPAAVALRARALARRCTGDLSGAIVDLNWAVKVAGAASLPRREGEARMSLVVALADAGRTSEALDEADRARPLLRGTDVSRLLAQRALVLQRIGRYEDALAGYRQALPGLRRDGDALWEARLLGNRGPLRAYLGDHRGAVSDLRRCEEVAAVNGLGNQVARARQNLGFAMILVGDLPAALELLDDAAELAHGGGFDDSSLVMDRAEALLSAGLGAEAAECASAALVKLEDRGLAYDATEARLLLARAALNAGRARDARMAAEQAAAEFARQLRPTWVRLARQVAVLARWDAGERGADLTRAARRSADDCAAAGWTLAALTARLVAGRSALESGSPAAARRLLADVAGARRSGGAGRSDRLARGGVAPARRRRPSWRRAGAAPRPCHPCRERCRPRSHRPASARRRLRGGAGQRRSAARGRGPTPRCGARVGGTLPGQHFGEPTGDPSE